jgi:hypothetical protein
MIAGMSWRSTMMSNITTIGLDIAKSVFQVHAVDSAGEVVVRRKLTRGRVLAFSKACRDAWSGSRPAALRIFGLAS